MRYRHRFRVRAPLARVADFHAQAASMPAITPPPLKVALHASPERLAEGDEMEFALRMGPIAIPWRARIEQVSPQGFVDRQLSGPFRAWQHQHRFVPVDEAHTEVVDQVEARLRPHLWWGPVGLAMWLGLPLLFAYRGWKTRRLIQA